MRNIIAILTILTFFSCTDKLSPEEQLESDNLSHVLSIHSCDSLEADSVYLNHVEILIDSTTTVPKTILGSIQLLDASTNKYAKHMFATCPPGKFHLGFGMWMRHNWGLWANRELAQEIRQTFEIDHPDSMSGVLLRLNSACCSTDKKRISEFFNIYRNTLNDSLAMNKLNVLETEINKWKGI